MNDTIPIPTASPGPASIELIPAWTWWHRDAPDRGYSKAELLEDRVVGLWFSLDRRTGEMIWRAEDPLPNDLFAIRDGMMIGTEMLAYGPTTGTYGVYGITLDTGRVAWIHHREDWHEVDPPSVALIDPQRDEDWRRHGPEQLTDDGLMTHDGRILDLRTGELIDRVDPKTTADYIEEWEPPTELFSVGALDIPGLGRLLLGTGENLAEVREHLAEPMIAGFFTMPTHMGWGEPFGFTFESPDGDVLWQFDLDPDRYWTHGNMGSYRELGRFVVLVYAEPTSNPRDFEPLSFGGDPGSAPFFAAVLDLASGKITSTLPLGDRPAHDATIEAVDEHGLLLSADFDSDRLYLYVAF